MHKENSGEKRRRKIINKGPVLVRSVKPGQTSAASYTRESSSGSNSIWKD